MKVALVVPRIAADPEANLSTIERMAGEAVSSGANVVLLPEAVLTGLINNDVPAHDLPLGEPIPGPATERLGRFCARHGVWLGFGMLEREDNRLYDSAVLLGPDGSTRLRYRRNHRNWHAKDADPAVYIQGTEVVKADTPFGAMGFLICGDMFDDSIVSRFRDLRADWLLYCVAVGFDVDQHRWDTTDLPAYSARVKLGQTPTLMVNYVADPSLTDDCGIGGAFVFSAEGEVLASYPLFTEGILLVDLGIASP